MNSEKLNRISFFYFMSVLTAGLLTVGVLFTASQVKQWQSRQELLVYTEPGLAPLVEAELKVFLSKTPYAAMTETLEAAQPLSLVLAERASVVVLQHPLTIAERASLTTAGIEVKELQVDSVLYVITPASASRSGRKLAAFLGSKAGRDVAVRHLHAVRAGKPS